MLGLVRTLILVVGLVGATVSATPTKKCAYTNYRLPKHIVPRHYDLLLTIDIEGNICDGMATIQLEVTENTIEPRNIIFLNAHPDVKVTDVIYLETEDQASPASNLKMMNVINYCQDKKNELLIVQLEKGLADGVKGELKVWFEAKIRDDGTGIYKTDYKTQAGVISYQISTDFKPNKARRAFPCFDEPAFKATFEITLNYDPDMIALSNTNSVSTVDDVSFRTSTFERTPEMSTYLVAFVIGKFDYIESKFFGERLKIRAISQEGKSPQVEFAIQTAVSAIMHLEEYFSIPFPLKKLDMISVVQHNSAATENWGLVVCNEASFLFDPKNMSPISKGDVASTVIQAVTKQWFGNLVSLEWWDDLWLQEGFAGWMANFLIDKMYPELQWEQHYLIERQQEALEKDSEWSPRPVRVAVNGTNIDKILEDFHLIKSAAVIRMLRDDYVGSEHFRDGIRRYLDENKHRNVNASELWKILTFLSGKPVEEFIRSWTAQAGHPLVSTRLSSDRRKLIVNQKHESKQFSNNRIEHNVWIIPVKLLWSNSKRQPEPMEFILDQSSFTVDLPSWFYLIKRQNSWIKVNAYSHGFYRTHHTSRSQLLWRLQIPCEKMILSPNDRIGLIDEVEALNRHNLFSLTKFPKVLAFYTDEIRGSVLGRVSRSFSLLRPLNKEATELGLKIFQSVYDHHKLSSLRLQNAGTPDGMGAADAFGLVTAYSTLLELSYEPLISEALALFNDKRNEVEPVIRELVYKVVALRGSADQIYRLVSLLNLGDNCEEEVNRINAALALLRGVPDTASSSSQGVRERPEILPDRIKRTKLT